MTNKKKTSRQKRTLIGAICVAAVIMAGSTFAWFTSQDEVTNRLSASANYDVSIAEDFQPPENWLPGQKINKDVSAVNTGNVDAFVRMWLGGQMRLLNKETTGTAEAVKPDNVSLTSTLTAVTDEDLKALGLTWQKATGSTPVYYRTLSTKKIDNANDASHATATNEETNSPATFSEVQSMMAGGVLVYAPANAGYHWTLEQAAELPVYTAANGETAADTTMTNLAKNTVVGSSKSTATGVKTLAPLSDSDSNYYGAIDASTFQPETEGLYLFRRNVKETPDGTANTYEYSGYYYVPASGSVPEQYFALHTDTGANGKSDYVLPQNVINDNSTATPSLDQVLPVTIAENQKVYLYTATEKVLDSGDDKLNWKYEDAVTTEGSQHPARFVVSYGEDDKKIEINVNLDNISTTDAEAWTVIKDDATTPTQKTTFYYNNDVESGDTTRKLVDSVELSKDTKNGAYLAFDFDLNVNLESIQVAVDEAGKEMVTPVKPWSAKTDGAATPANLNTGATVEDDTNYAKTYTDITEISVVGWKAIS